jgi:hypothetical protein
VRGGRDGLLGWLGEPPRSEGREEALVVRVAA